MDDSPGAERLTALVARDRAHLWHPYAPAVSDPLFAVVDARGTRLTLEDGRQVVDGMSSWWAAIHGYRHPVLDAALHAQVDRFAHVMFGGLTHEPAVVLGELLVSITPEPLTRVFFADSGSVAVEVALKMAIQATGVPRVLTIRGGYHGDTAGAMSVTDPAGMHALFRGYLPEQLFVPRPRPLYDEACTEEDLAPVVRALTTRDVAAVIVEPVVQGAGGMRWYSPDYLRRLVSLCRERGVLVVFDEIATGFGRTGELWGMDHAGVVPDILCLGKALTGGTMTLGAVLCTDAVAEKVEARGGALMHGPTFMANPLACAVATASTDLLLGQDWRGTVARVGAELRAGLEAARDLPGVADVRVLGAIGVVELDEPCDMKVLQPRLVDEGAWVRPFGKLVYVMPPYVSTTEDVATVTGAIVRSLTP
ncbi:MAG TPA: adenosylmethionine--8-amino-7-oxononanoate transaminase [Mycobacteriales bacterium]|nr:adenosylmethionine--8-amino-7-oxononanoate transaminase [Mycobacteriales bacterium]